MTTTNGTQTEPQLTPRLRNSYSGSLAEQIRQVIQQNPYYSTRLVCTELHLDYQKYGQYVRNQKSLLNCNKCNKLPHESHRNKYVWIVPEWERYREKLRESRWHFSKRNKLWFFKHNYGSLLWHNTNRIELFLSGKPIVGYAKTVFTQALIDYIDIKEIDRVFNSGHIESRHHSFLIGEKVPRFQIDYFANSHGLTILNDNSHARSIEIVENKPFWLDDLQKIAADFKENMAKHMQLLHAMDRMQQQINMRIGQNLLSRVKKLLAGVFNG